MINVNIWECLWVFVSLWIQLWWFWTFFFNREGELFLLFHCFWVNFMGCWGLLLLSKCTKYVWLTERVCGVCVYGEPWNAIEAGNVIKFCVTRICTVSLLRTKHKATYNLVVKDSWSEKYTKLIKKILTYKDKIIFFGAKKKKT